jgi:hypothetical protein
MLLELLFKRLGILRVVYLEKRKEMLDTYQE